MYCMWFFYLCEDDGMEIIYRVEEYGIKVVMGLLVRGCMCVFCPFLWVFF